MNRRKWTKVILILVAVIWAAFFTTDMVRCENEQTPIFCLETEEGSVWTGLFYKVTYLHWIDAVCEPGDVEVDGGFCFHEKWEMSTWFSNPTYE